MSAATSGVGNTSERLTTLCPLKDRPEHFRRFLIGLELVQWREPVVFLDGSGTGTCDEVWVDAQAHANLGQVEYVRFPEDKGWREFLAKMLTGLDRVKTEFVHLTSDDDFPDENNLLLACDLMSARSDVALVSGKVVDFEVRGRKAHPHRDVYGSLILEQRHLDCSGRYSEAESVLGDTPRRRLGRQSRAWPYEGVWRTECLREVFSIAKRAGASTYRTLLPIMRTVALSRGKLIHTDDVFTLRQDNTQNSDGAAMIAAHPTRLDFFANPNTVGERQRVNRELLRLAFVEEGGLEDAIAVAAWEFHDLLEELKRVTSRLERTSAHEEHGFAVFMQGISRRLQQTKNRGRKRTVILRGEQLPNRADIQALSLEAWYPGDKQLVAAASASVQSFGRRDDARATFKLLQDVL